MGKYSREQTMAAYWAIGTYWGKAQSNNKKGHLIGHIKDIGYDPSQPTTRLYATHAAQPWHNDSSDQVGECSCPLVPPVTTASSGLSGGLDLHLDMPETQEACLLERC